MENALDHRRVIRARKQRERDRRVQEIQDAAKKVFFSKGYRKATMDEIALEAALSKPTIYQYFRTKDDLFFSLMLPLVDDVGRRLHRIEAKLLAGKHATGGDLIRDLFRVLYGAYAAAPDAFRILQLFQYLDLVKELHLEVRGVLDARGARNFRSAREIVALAVERGLLAPVDPHGLVDVLWGLFLGIAQIEEIKSREKPGKRFLRPTLRLAEELVISSVAVKR